jgi:hypothetical protein
MWMILIGLPSRLYLFLLVPFTFNVPPATMALFLGLVTSAIKAEPSADSLYKLLQLADPDLSPAGIRTKAAREKLYKKLRADVNPSLSAFKELTTFYEQCATCNFAAVAVKREITPAKEENPSKRSRLLLPFKFSCEEQ